MSQSRRCTKCAEVKPLDAFSLAKRGRYGRRSCCKECIAAQRAATYVAIPRQRRREPFTGEELKTCTVCRAEKRIREFSLSRKATETQNAVYRSECKPCASAKALQWHRDNPGRTSARHRKAALKRYGLSVAEYDALVLRQGGVCAICRKAPDSSNSRIKRLVVDHCHDSGAIRGLLCNNCNRALGLLGDDPVMLRRMISYLMRSNSRTAA